MNHRSWSARRVSLRRPHAPRWPLFFNRSWKHCGREASTSARAVLSISVRGRVRCSARGLRRGRQDARRRSTPRRSRCTSDSASAPSASFMPSVESSTSIGMSHGSRDRPKSNLTHERCERRSMAERGDGVPADSYRGHTGNAEFAIWRGFQHPVIRFGTEGSEVQILSPRPKRSRENGPRLTVTVGRGPFLLAISTLVGTR
jgi:hypothetical protein